MIVTLEPYEVAMCAGVGVKRRVASMEKGIKNAPGFARTDLFELDIQGACAEYAFAKAMGVLWDGAVGTYKRADVGNVQVKLSQQTTSFLIVQPKADPNEIYVLVTGTAPSFKVVGWAWASDVKKQKYLKRFGTRPMVYAMPLSALKPVGKLPRKKAGL